MTTLYIKDAPEGWQDNPDFILVGGEEGLFALPKGASKAEFYNGMRKRIYENAEDFYLALSLASKTLVYRHKSTLQLVVSLVIEAHQLKHTNAAYGVIEQIRRDRRREEEAQAVQALRERCAKLSQKWSTEP
jgi:hypothetical protein